MQDPQLGIRVSGAKSQDLEFMFEVLRFRISAREVGDQDLKFGIGYSNLEFEI